jgi:hypothetical protein
MTARRTIFLLILILLGAASAACDLGSSDPVVIGEYHAPTKTVEAR